MSPRVPLVGLTTYVERASWGPWTQDAALVPSQYYELVAAAGARPLLVPQVSSASAGTRSGLDEVIDMLDALVVIGGLDVDPSCYSAHPDSSLGRTDLVHDETDLRLTERAIATDTPMLAICRGHQVLNVAMGGTLIQHLPNTLGHAEHQPETGSFTQHPISCVPGTKTAAIFGEEPTVACSHHQAIDRLADGLVATAHSIELAGIPSVIEAVERPGSRFCIGVQWHPEETNDVRPFEALVAAI